MSVCYFPIQRQQVFLYNAYTEGFLEVETESICFIYSHFFLPQNIKKIFQQMLPKNT